MTSSSELEELVEGRLRQIENILIAEHESLRTCLKAKLSLLQMRPQKDDLPHQDVSPLGALRNKQVVAAGVTEQSMRRQKSPSPSDSLHENSSQSSAHAVLPGTPSDEKSSPEELPSLLGGDRASLKASQESPTPSKNSNRSKQLSNHQRNRKSLSSIASGMSLISFKRFYSHKGGREERMEENQNPENEVSGSEVGSDEKMFAFNMREQFQADCQRVVSAESMKHRGKSGLPFSSFDASAAEEHAKGLATRSRFRLMHPDSKSSIAFEILSMLFIIHDLIAMPLQVFQEDDASVVERAARIYWVVNLFIEFGTGYFDQQGQLVTDISRVARRYALSWLGFDVAMVVIDILLWISEASGRRVRILLAFRLVRLLRLIRLVAMTKFFRSYLALHATSGRFNVAVGVGKTMTLMLCLAHLAACGWYGASKWYENNWVASANIEKEPLWTRYIFALHWAVVQYAGDSGIQPQNAAERTYAFVVQFFAFILATIMASDLTTLMTQMQFIALQDRQQCGMLQQFLHENNVGTRFASRVMDNARLTIEERKRRPDERQVELLNHVSLHLLVELHYKMHVQYLVGHPFFRGYNIHSEPGMRNLCHAAVRMELVSSGDVLFSTGEVAKDPCMYFVKEGSLRYQIFSDARDLGPGSCVNEPALWVEGWEQLGILEVEETSHVLTLVVHAAVEAMHQFRTAELYPKKYASMFVEELNRVSASQISDVSSDFLNLKGMAHSIFSSGRRQVTHISPE